MKVAYFIGSLNRGGTETLVLDSFRRRDVAPFESILIYRNDGELTEQYRATGVQMFRVKPRWYKIGYLNKLRKILRCEQVAILHTQTLFNAFLGIFCVCFTPTKLVASFHGLHFSVKNRLLAQFVIWFADASVFVSDYVRRWYLRHTLFAPANHCHVVYNGIDFAKFDKMYSIPDFLDQTASKGRNDGITLAMVGSFVGGRSQRFVCESIKRLQDEGFNDFRFYFIGRRSKSEPDYYDECVKFCSENGLLDKVFFLGERSDVPAVLQNIDGFVYSSNHDTFGIAVVEAIASGIPVIVNDWDVMKEISDNGRLVFLYKSGDVQDCVMRIKSLCLHRDEYLAKAKESSRVVRERYSIENHIKALHRVYQKALL